MAELSLIAKATVILVAALAVTRLAGSARASVRSLILATAFGLVLTLPLAALVVPPRTIEVSEAYAPAFFTAADIQTTGVPVTTALSRSSDHSWHLPSAVTLARTVWASGVVASALPLILGLWRLRGLRRRGRACPEVDELVSMLRDSSRTAVDVILLDDLIVPMTCGWRHPIIALPKDAAAWPAADVRQALLHELEHVRRRDWPVHVVARLTCALYWFHPAAWMAWRQLSLESERACDDAVVVQAENSAYAQQLVSLARRFAKGEAAPLLSMADRSTLSTRVRAVLDAHQRRGRPRVLHALAIAIAALALTAGISPLRAVTAVPATPQKEAAPVRFEVASVRPNTSPQPGQTMMLQGNTFVARNVTARDLVLLAFGMRQRDQVSGASGWIDTDRFDIYARPEREVPWEQHLLMLQTLLADRFQLAFRRETRPSPAYALVVSAKGSKLTPSNDQSCASPPRNIKCGGFWTHPGGFVGRRVTLEQIARILSGRSGRPVVNRTAMDGFFDVELTWTPDPSQLPRGPGPDDVPPTDPSGPSLFTAIEEQLGLKLESTTAPLDHIVIERIARPTPNDVPSGGPRPKG